MGNKDKRFIEDTFPIRDVSVESAKEKNIRQGHISTLHIWWARRPLAASRATNLAALIPVSDSEEEKQKIRNFIAELSKWENSNNENLLKKARKMILDANGGVPPKVFDPFGGGGSIPLEALRLGCETYSNDYNPVAVLIQKCTLEYPQKYGKLIPLSQYLEERQWLSSNSQILNELGVNNMLFNESQVEYVNEKLVNPLLEDVKYWGNRLMEETKKEIGENYPIDSDGSVTVAYIWARTIPCQNPACNIEIPLLRQFWLCKNINKKVILYPYIKDSKVYFKIINGNYKIKDANFDPERGTVERAVVNCPACGSIIDDKTTRKLFQQGKANQRMVALVTYSKKTIELKKEVNETIKQLHDEVPFTIVKALKDKGFVVEKEYFSKPDKTGNGFKFIYNDDNHYIEFKVTHKLGKITIIPQGKAYRISTNNDVLTYNKTEKFLEKKREKLMNKWGIDPVPDEDIPLMSGVFNVPIYSLNKWGKLFNTRQLNSILCLLENAKKIYNVYKGENIDAIISYIGLAIDMSIAFGNTLCRWENTSQLIKQLFGRQALPMLWDYAEYNPFSKSSGSLEIGIEYYGKVIEHCSLLSRNSAIIINKSAINLPFKENYFDAVFTDPPYYNSVPYADLSDFFYVWLKRLLNISFPELFSTPLSPKTGEITEMAGWDPIRYPEKDKNFFEANLKKSFQEINRILKPQGIATIVYAHKSTSGWETVINALLDSGLIITGSYPINTEMQNRLRASDSASLSSSIYIIARKLERKGTGFYTEVKEELKNYLNFKLDQLWGEGIVGADFFIAAIGSAIEVFGKYEKVMDYEGNIKRADTLLDDVREVVMNYTVAHILHNGFSGEVSELTKFYVICRFSYGEAKLEFDEANKLARSVGIDLMQEFNKNGFIKKEKEFVRVLAANNRKIDELQDKFELIDVLHHSLLLWEADKKDKMMQLLAETGFGKSEALFRVAQAISESLAKTSPDSKEKKWIDQFVSTKDRIKANITTTIVKPKKEQQGKIQFE